MWFLVVWNDSGKMAFKKVSKSALFSLFDFDRFVNNVIQFTQEAGIGDCITVGNCLVIRTR